MRNIYGMYSDWDPNNNLRYVIREYFGEYMLLPAFEDNHVNEYIEEFYNNKIVEDPNGKIKKTELNGEFTIWYQSTYGHGAPSPKELYSYMEKKLGKFEKKEKGAWTGAKIRYDREEQMYTNDNGANSL
jgi:hypothetical protein